MIPSSEGYTTKYWKHALDLCAGGGVQGLGAVWAGMACRAVLVERNERATRMAKFNALINGVEDKIMVVVSYHLIFIVVLFIYIISYFAVQCEDITADDFLPRLSIHCSNALTNTDTETDAALDLLPSFDLILANPPYIPSAITETGDAAIPEYGDGGSQGEDVTKAIVAHMK